MIKEPYATLLNDIVRVLREEFKDDLISVVLYGSVARGDNRNDSDVDLLIVINNLPKDSVLKRIRDIFCLVLKIIKKRERTFNVRL